MKREVCFLLGVDGEVLWTDASESAVALPDSRARWEAIWQHRETLTAIVHSHPVGPRAFSHEDLTTMEALDAALGRPLLYLVLAPDGLCARWGESDLPPPEGEPHWAQALRDASGMTD